MSIEVMTEVWRRSTVYSGNLLVLLAIADFADDDGKAFPSVTTLARKARLSERQVQRAISALVKAGELTVRKGAGPHGAHVFHVLLVAPRQIDAPTKWRTRHRRSDGPTPVTNAPDAGVANTPTPVSPKPSVEPSPEPSREPSLPVPPPGLPRDSAQCDECLQIVRGDGFGHLQVCRDYRVHPDDPRFRARKESAA